MQNYVLPSAWNVANRDGQWQAALQVLRRRWTERMTDCIGILNGQRKFAGHGACTCYGNSLMRDAVEAERARIVEVFQEWYSGGMLDDSFDGLMDAITMRTESSSQPKSSRI